MALDGRALEAKKSEIKLLSEEALKAAGAQSSSAATIVESSFVRLTAPDEPEARMNLILIKAPFGRASSASSIKPGNIYLSWSRLMDVVPDIVVAGAGVASGPPWLLPFIGLYIWNKLWCSAKEELSDAEATAIFALWKNKDASHKISEVDGFNHTNALRKAWNLQELTKLQFDEAVTHLLRMNCLEMEEGIMWLREWVKVTYY